MVVVVSKTGLPTHLVAKYRPRVPVLVVTDNEQVARACAPWYGLYAEVVPKLPNTRYVKGVFVLSLCFSSSVQLSAVQCIECDPTFVCLSTSPQLWIEAQRVYCQHGPTEHVALIDSCLVMNATEHHRQLLPLLSVLTSHHHCRLDVNFDIILEQSIIKAVQRNLCPPGKEVVVLHGVSMKAVDVSPMVYTKVSWMLDQMMRSRLLNADDKQRLIQ